MRNVTCLLACAATALALVAVPGLADTAAAGNQGVRAQLAAQGKRQNLTRFVLREAAKALGVRPGQLARELRGRSLAQVAAAHGKSAAELQAAVVAAFKARLDARVAAGKLTQDRANTQLARFQRRVSRLMTQVFRARPAALRSGSRVVQRGVVLSAAASYLGLTRQQLRAQLPGRSLAQLAVARERSVQGLEQAIVAAVKARLDALVARQRISQERASRVLARFQDRVDEIVNRVRRSR
jgi:hypothetical protein